MEEGPVSEATFGAKALSIGQASTIARAAGSDAGLLAHAWTIAKREACDGTLNADAWTMDEGPVSEATFSAKALSIEACAHALTPTECARTDATSGANASIEEKGKLDYYAVASLLCGPTRGPCTAVGTRAKEDR